jgi:HAE1 family hydrophobic/amphiphilic exporter-1
MVVVSLLMLGGIAWSRIDIEFTPAFEFPFVRCLIPYPGATPEQVANEIAIPAEGQFRTISNMERITSTSDSNGCDIRMQFDWGTDMSLATAEVRDRIERLKLTLPQDVERIHLRHFSSESMPVLALGLYRDGDDEEFAYLVRRILQPQIMRVDGVANVIIFTRPEREVTIEFNQRALRSLGLGIYEVVSALQTSSLNMAVGEMTEGETKYYVRVLGEYEGLDQIRDLVVASRGVRLRDVADVTFQARDPDYWYAIDDKTGVFVLILKESEANTVDVCRSVKKQIDMALQDPAFKGMETFVFFDQSDLILSALNNLMQSGRYGALLAFIVLLLFLQRMRPTLLVAFAIPSSLVVALVVMYFTGMTLNIATMVSMIIAVGMLVDNSIVVVENIYRYNQLGFDQIESSRRGASEVGLAITASTLTTVVVFIPVFYLQGGQMSVYMQQFAVPITVSLVASLALALTVIPLATSRMRPRSDLALYRWYTRWREWRRAHRPRTKAPRRELHPVKALINAYTSTLQKTLQWPLTVLGILAVLLSITIAGPMKNIPMQRLPQLDTREVHIRLSFEQGFDHSMVREITDQVYDVLDTQRAELGIKNIFVNTQPRRGEVNLYLLKPEDLPPHHKIPYTTEEVGRIIKARLPERVPGAEVDVDVAQAEEQPGGGKLAVRLRGEDPTRLASYADQFTEALRTLPFVTEAEVDDEQAEQEIQLQVKGERSEEVGVSPFVVARTVDFALRGSRLPYLKQEGREIPVWAQFREEDRKTRGNLDNVSIMGTNGELIPLSQLVTFTKATSKSSIRREDGKNVITVTATTDQKDMLQVRGELERLIAMFDLPPGYSVQLGDQFEELDVDLTNLFTTMAMAIILIFIVMSALFESVLLPLSILTCVPLAFIGVVWTLALTGTPLDTIGIIGCILMVGIVVNNGIVIVDHINFLRGQGLPRTQAILQAGADRFRPVMMTALTTILGCIPLAIGGSSGGSMSFASLGRSLIGGLSVATLLTLLIVPLFYSLIDDGRVWMGSFAGSLARLGRSTRR